MWTGSIWPNQHWSLCKRADFGPFAPWPPENSSDFCQSGTESLDLMFRMKQWFDWQSLYLVWLIYLKHYWTPVIKSLCWLLRLPQEMRQDSGPQSTSIIVKRGTNTQPVVALSVSIKCYYGHCKMCHENGKGDILVLGQAHMNAHTHTRVRVWRLPVEAILSRDLKENRRWQRKGGWSGCSGQRPQQHHEKL